MTHFIPKQTRAMNRWLFLFFFISGLFASESASWSSFRGPASGLAAYDNAPLTWDGTTGAGVLWKTPLSKVGVSSPVLWGNYLFVSEGDDSERALMAFEADSGRLLWRQVITDGGGAQPLPPVNETGLAMPTPTCDAKGVYVLFGTGDLAAFTVTGEKKWQIFLQRPALGYGFSSSPVLVGDLLAVQFDDLHQGRILGIDTTSGKIRWQKERSRGASWSSPHVIPGSEHFIVNANGSVTAFHKDGLVLWDEDGVTGQVTPSVSWWNHRVFVVNGLAGMMSYEVSGAPKLVWKNQRPLTDVASPLVHQGLVFMVTSGGRIDCLDALTGQEVWTQQGPGCHSSLVASGERVYALGRDGITLVFAAKRQYQELAKNRLGEASDATPAIGQGRMWIRGRGNLWCLGTIEAEKENRKKYNETGSFGAHMQTPKISTSEEADGTISLLASVPLLGGCCFSLTSTNVAATLDVPPGMTVLRGPTPATYAALEAPVSGIAKVSADFRWVLQRSSPQQEYPLSITVTSSNSGPVKASTVLGATISLELKGPELPKTLPLGQEIPLVVDVRCKDENRYVKTVAVWYSTEVPPGAKPQAVTPEQAKSGLLSFQLDGRSILVQGRCLELQRRYEPTLWYGNLPAQTQGPLFVYALATDDRGARVLGEIHVSAGVPSIPPVAQTNPHKAVWLLLLGGVLLLLAVVLGRGAHPHRKLILVVFACLGVLCLVLGLMARKADRSSAVEMNAGYPVESSSLVVLFLDTSETSERLMAEVERLRSTRPHRIHVLCFVEGFTPAPLLATYKARWKVRSSVAMVVDCHQVLEAVKPEHVAAVIETSLQKEPSRLSMEMREGLSTTQQVSSGFIMCNHSPRPNAVGAVTAFALERQVQVGSWQCRSVVRQVLAQDKSFAIPAGKCQPPLIMQAELPSGVNPAKISSIILVVDENGRLIDAICTEKPCSRTGICG